MELFKFGPQSPWPGLSGQVTVLVGDVRHERPGTAVGGGQFGAEVVLVGVVFVEVDGSAGDAVQLGLREQPPGRVGERVVRVEAAVAGLDAEVSARPRTTALAPRRRPGPLP
ncbi:MAG: hypothetical protein ACR2G2_09375 [Pseudonocardia sp.]